MGRSEVLLGMSGVSSKQLTCKVPASKDRTAEPHALEHSKIAAAGLYQCPYRGRYCTNFAKGYMCGREGSL